jgi:hypothetical protein
MELLKEILSIILYFIITGAGIIVIKKVLSHINVSIDDIQANTKLAEYEKLNIIIDRVQSVMTNVVQSVNQEFVDELKKSGTFTKETAIEAKDMALNLANKMLTEEAANAIEQVYGDVDMYLNTLIEDLVKNLKK